MNISPQKVDEWLRGNEDFTLSTVGRLEEVLEIDLIQVPNRHE